MDPMRSLSRSPGFSIGLSLGLQGRREIIRPFGGNWNGRGVGVGVETSLIVDTEVDGFAIAGPDLAKNGVVPAQPDANGEHGFGLASPATSSVA
jgi:hypothetical protein